LLADFNQFQAQLAAKYGAVLGVVCDLSTIQECLPADAALVAWIDVADSRVDMKETPHAADPQGEHWACVVRPVGAPNWIRLAGTGADGQWTDADDSLSGQLRASLRSPDAAHHDTDWEAIADSLCQQRLVPLLDCLGVQDDLPQVRQLIVLPSPALAGLPIEVMVSVAPPPWIHLTISYAPSATMITWLRGEKTGRSTKPQVSRSSRLLAVGDPAFSTTDKTPSLVADTVTSALDDGDEGLRALRKLLSEGSSWSPSRLPGTRWEVERIAALFDQPTTFLGTQATEPQLERLVEDGQLQGFDVIHLATHGVLDSVNPLSSALILAPASAGPNEDHGDMASSGRVTAEQILRTWNLRADLVTLSACQTGLGEFSGGEGYLGFAQALFLAGARSLVLSLWKVDDHATALLMHRFYENLLGARSDQREPMSPARALMEAKYWLKSVSDEAARQLSQHDRERDLSPSRQEPATSFAHPYFWAAFVLVGCPRLKHLGD
jgi:hypothetical protein